MLLVPTDPQEDPPPRGTRAREQKTHHRDGLPVDKCWLVASGVVKAQKSLYLKMGPFCSMDLEHVCP